MLRYVPHGVRNTLGYFMGFLLFAVSWVAYSVHPQMHFSQIWRRISPAHIQILDAHSN